MVLVLPPDAKLDATQLALVGGALLAAYKLVQWYRSSAEKAPAAAKIHTLPSTLPVVGNMLDAIQHGDRWHDWITQHCVELDGGLWRLKMPGRADVIMISTPDMMEDVTKTHFDTFIKGPFQHDWLRDYMGDGIFTSDGERWVNLRKTAARFFSARLLREHMTECIKKNAKDVYRVLDHAAAHGEVVNLHQLFKEFAMQAFAKMGFGIEINCVGASEDHPFQAAMDTAAQVLVTRFRRPVWVWKLLRWLDVGVEAKLSRAIGITNEAVYRMARESIETTTNPATKLAQEHGTYRPKSVLELFLQAVDSEYMKTIKVEDLRDFALVFMVAGRDTTSDTFAWFFYHVLKDPVVERKLREELARKLPDFVNIPDTDGLKMEDMSSLVYLEAAVKETLRLYPQPPLNVRECTHDTVLSNGALVRKGELIGLAAFAMARSPVVWGDDAAAFNPDRWVDSETQQLKTISSFKFIAFHAGPRSCLGENLAMLELKMLIVNLFARFEFDMLPGNDGTYDVSMAMSLKHPLLARIKTASFTDCSA